MLRSGPELARRAALARSSTRPPWTGAESRFRSAPGAIHSTGGLVPSSACISTVWMIHMYHSASSARLRELARLRGLNTETTRFRDV
jgi:hypothetical protein